MENLDVNHSRGLKAKQAGYQPKKLKNQYSFLVSLDFLVYAS